MTNYVLFGSIFALAICLIFLVVFEKRRPKARDILPIVIMCVVASIGRLIFSFLPSVQPVTAIVIIMGVCFGPMTGFATGCLSALISNLFMGHGPWTPWQMLAWGTIGIVAGLIAHFKFGKNIYVLTFFGIISGFFYSLMMDIYTILTLWEGMNVSYALTVWGVGLVYNIGHAISNGLFIFLLYKPLSRKLLRLKTKYGILDKKGDI